METFELISKDIENIKVRDKYIPFDSNYQNYEKLGIEVRDFDNNGNTDEEETFSGRKQYIFYFQLAML